MVASKNLNMPDGGTLGPNEEGPSSLPHEACRGAARPWLLLYLLSGCGEEEALAFEAHLLSCEACFRDLQTLDRARSLLREHLGARSPVLDRLSDLFQSVCDKGEADADPEDRPL